MSLSVDLEVCTPPPVPERSGPYDLVRETRPLYDREKPNGRIWFNANTEDTVTEERVEGNRPFGVGIVDLDGLLVKTEHPGGFFDARRTELMREAGISGSDNDLGVLMAGVYRWEGTFPVSVDSMVGRIQRRQGLDGRGLDESASEVLGKLLQAETLKRWADLNGQVIDDPTQSAPNIIAHALDRIGVAMLDRNPEIVSEVAPIMPGAEELVRAFPQDMPLCIASGSGKKSIIEPILRAHAAVGQPFLYERFTRPPGYIVGEEDIRGTPKPQRMFYEEAAWRLAHLLRGDRLIPPGGMSLGDAVFIGNPIGGRSFAGGNVVPDIAMTRRNGMNFVSVGVDAHDVNAYGPLTASVADVSSLLTVMRSPEHSTNTTLKRLAQTLHF